MVSGINITTHEWHMAYLLRRDINMIMKKFEFIVMVINRKF